MPTPTPRIPTPRAAAAATTDITVTVSETVQLQQYEPFRVEITLTRKDIPENDVATTARQMGSQCRFRIADIIADRKDDNDVPF